MSAQILEGHCQDYTQEVFVSTCKLSMYQNAHTRYKQAKAGHKRATKSRTKKKLLEFYKQEK